MKNIYLDDIRVPIGDWIVVRNFEEFVNKVREITIDDIHIISFDHDLGDFSDGEKTGMDCLKWLIEFYLDEESEKFPKINVHSKNPVGRENIISLGNNFLKSIGSDERCTKSQILNKFPTF